MDDWYKLDSVDVTEKLDVNVDTGLSDAEAQQRLSRYGLNELIDKGTKNPWLILLDQFKDVMVIILLIAAVVSFFLSEDLTDVIVIMAIVVLNAGIGFSQEYRAEQAIAALKKLAVPTVRVRRDGRITEISARQLVPGDVVLLEAGNLVPADGRLVESINLKIEEAALTGESEPVEKATAVQSGDHISLGDQHNMVFMGTIITYGRGTAVITATGMSTQLGKIADLIQGVEQEATPLQRRLDGLGKSLAWVAMGIIAVVVVLGLLRGEKWDVLLLTGISMAVAAVPEGLPAVVTITLALGSQRMLKRHALIRKLPAVETLGSVTVICSDKTGTLTENRMTVTMLDVVGHTQDIDALVDESGAIFDAALRKDHPIHDRTLSLLVKASALCNDAVLQKTDEGTERTIGDPTEGALVVAAAKLGHTKERMAQRWPRVGEVPFTSERKRMTTIHRVLETDASDATIPWNTEPFVAFSKGGVDSLLDVADRLWDGKDVLPLDEALRERILSGNARLAQQGQRVLGVAFRPLQTYDEHDEAGIEANMIMIGLVAMMDPPRPEVKEAVITARTAGIRPVMITGDHPLTAQHIAKELTIAERDYYLTGRDLSSMDVQELEKVVHDVPVYARVSPEHKLNIVMALQDKGEIVAMTGDGVNDAPALKKADIGVAMGITGTDVSKEAADMVLLDDNFATIVAAIEEGRKVYDNIRKFIKYTLSSNTGELIVMLAAPFLGMPLPLVPLQILWINLVTDGLPGLALAVEDSERGIMKRTPFRPNESIFSRGMGQRIIWIGILMGIVSLLMGYLYWDPNNPTPHGTWQTMTFTTLTLAQMGNALAIRSNQDSLLSIGIFSNRLMVLSVVLTFVLQLALIYVPFLQNVFNTVALSGTELIFSLLASAVVFVAVELEKWFRRSRERQS
ncbi:MAG: cation-translocating P-type ATPase [Ardenticatenaceae bacterium]|nr:cation-translocating P-type ATPase [Anaerolineales bacterium]MCB8920398.1 cation-translocating P-type ATPase [Ardenticatenaceae bacterium]MCB8989353.1 cation-translocating P-type ATPase [Ardenticatenaceae bacterium]MCB9004508.1 cation-translocating P-type ATPase [Ardenticatenaceae bacterium]